MGKVPRYREEHVTLGKLVREGGQQATPEALRELLDDPFGILADTKRWPVLNDVVASERARSRLYLGWLASRAIAAGGVWEQAVRSEPTIGLTVRHVEVRECGETVATAVRRDTPKTLSASALAWAIRNAGSLWPFPVGKGCDIVQDDSPFGMLRELMPLEGEAYAALVLPLTVYGTQMDVFFLVEPQEWETMIAGERLPLPDCWVNRGELKRILPNGERMTHGTFAVFDDCRAWWRDRAADPVKPGPGRKHGAQQKWTFEDVLTRLADYRREHGSKPPTQAAFIEHIGLSEDTWKVLRKRWGLTWDDLKKPVYCPTVSVDIRQN